MRKPFLVLSYCLLATAPAMAQILPLSPQQLQQQSDAAIQKSTDSLTRGMTQQQIGQIEQDQRRAQLFQTQQPAVYPPYPVPQQSGTPQR